MEPKDRSIVNVLDLEAPRWLVVRRAPPPPSPQSKTGHKYKSTTAVETDDYVAAAEVVVRNRFASATATSDALCVDRLHCSSSDEESTASFDSRTAQDERDVTTPAAAATLESSDDTERRLQVERIVVTATEHFDATVQDERGDVATQTAAVAVESSDAIAQDERDVTTPVGAAALESSDAIAQDERDAATTTAAVVESYDAPPQGESGVATQVAAVEESFDAIAQDESGVATQAAAVADSFDATPQDECYYVAPAHFVQNKTPAFTKTSAIASFILASSAATLVCTTPADFDVVLGDSNDSARGGASTSNSNPTRSATEAHQRKCSLWARSKELITGCFANAGKRMCS